MKDQEKILDMMAEKLGIKDIGGNLKKKAIRAKEELEKEFEGKDLSPEEKIKLIVDKAVSLVTEENKKNVIGSKIINYKPGNHAGIKLRYFGGETDDFTVKLPGGLAILELKEASMEAISDEDKHDKKMRFKIGINKDSLIVKLFFERHVVSGSRSMDSLSKATPACLKQLMKWIEENVFSQIPSDESEADND